jgi:hypothetical protein
VNIAKACALIEKLAEIPYDSALSEWIALGSEARAILAEPPMKRGECMAKARTAAFAKRNAEMEARHAQVMPTILKLKGEGRTLREIADALNGMGFVPDRAAHYSHGVIALMLNRHWKMQRDAAQ